MEDIATGVTPAMDSTPAADPFVQQLLADKADLQQLLEHSEARNDAFARRLALHKEIYDKIAQIVQESKGTKGVEG